MLNFTYTKTTITGKTLSKFLALRASQYISPLHLDGTVIFPRQNNDRDRIFPGRIFPSRNFSRTEFFPPRYIHLLILKWINRSTLFFINKQTEYHIKNGMYICDKCGQCTVWVSPFFVMNCRKVYIFFSSLTNLWNLEIKYFW